MSGATERTEPEAIGTGAISGTVRERLAPLLVLFGALFAVSAPLAFFVMGARELDDRGRSLASQAAETLARYAEEQPVLWRYDSLKLVEHLRYFETQADVVRIDVVDAHGVPIDARSYEVPAESLAWTSAPLEVGGRRLGTVWVGSSRAALRQRASVVLLGFTLLSIVLAFFVYAIALRNARLAEDRIAGLVERLAARSMEERVRALEEMTGADSPHWGIDGCSAPNFATTVSGLAHAMAKMASPAGLGRARGDAAAALVAAMRAHPDLVAGEGRACTELMQAMGGRVAVKTGAEGVYVAILPERGLGIALKAEDGATRAAECAIATLLVRLGELDPADPACERRMAPVLPNRRGLPAARFAPEPALWEDGRRI